jgi:hypothetical protein
MWLLSVVLALGLVLNESAEAGSAEDHRPDISIESAGVFGQETTPATACHPGLICTAFVVPEGPATALSTSLEIVRWLDLTQSERRFAGPSLTLPPPRILT